ncbi:MAG TPA: thioredoxin domain-containing protein [Vicinamibacterales bacterium]|jgi:protein-disulfide isomerase|nr:thioredoxin domain-containing protein [Vicinamibacterales bacterium]
MRTVFIAGGLLISLACSSQAQQPGDAAARVGDRTITVAELDERWKSEEPGAKAQAEQAVYDGRKAALDAIIADMLVAQAAKAKGVTPEAFVQAEIGKRTKPVSDTDVRNFYVQNSERMQGRTFEQMSPAIEQYLEDQQQTTAKQDLIAELKKGGPAIRVVMDAPRTTVTVNPDDPSEGKADAAVTLVEYSDFQCPFCLRVMPTLKQLRAKYGDKLRIVWKDFPLTQIHPQAFVAAQAGNCAREQGKFWELHDKMFGNQSALQPEALKRYAAEAGVDAAKFNQCLDTSKYESRVQDAIRAGGRLGIQSTPTVYVNGRMINGAQPIEVFQAVIDEELARGGK